MVLRHAAIRAFQPAVLAAILVVWWAVSRAGLTGQDWRGYLVAAFPVVIAAMAQTFPIASGAQGLSAGGTMMLVNAIVARAASPGTASEPLWAFAGLTAGLLVGCLNGALVAGLGLSSMLVTLSTGAVAVAAALQIAGSGTGLASTPGMLLEMLYGWAPGGVPVVPLVVLIAAGAAGEAILRSRIGLTLRRRAALVAAGSEPPPESRAALFVAYVVASAGASVGGLFLAAELGTVDAYLGAPALVQILAAVALGGGVPGRGGGSVVGSAMGGLIVVGIGNPLLALELPDVLASSFDALCLLAGLALALPRLGFPSGPPLERPDTGRGSLALSFGFAAGLPAMLVLGWLRPGASDLATLAAGMGIVALGQAVLLRRNLLDLSTPGLIAVSSVAAVTVTQGHDGRLGWTVAMLFTLAAVVGGAHAFVARRAGRGAIGVTLATGALAQVGAAAMLVYPPTGFTPPWLGALSAAKLARIPLAAWAAILAAVGCAAFLATAGRRGATSGRGRAPTGAGYVVTAVGATGFGLLLASFGVTVRYGTIDLYSVPIVAAAALGGMAARDRAFASAAAVLGAACWVVLLDTLAAARGLGYAPRVAVAAAIILLAAFAGRARPDQPRRWQAKLPPRRDVQST